MPVTIDPRRYDAVLFDLDAVVVDSTVIGSVPPLVTQLRQVGIGIAVFSSRRDAPIPAGMNDLFSVCVEDGELPMLIEAAACVSARPSRCAVVVADAAGVTTARDAGFALVIGVERNAHRDALRHQGADTIVTDLNEVAVRTGDRRMSELPDAVQALDLANDLTPRQPVVFFDFDGTLSDIVDNPDAARLTAGAGEALQKLATHCPVAVLSGRDLADVSSRVGLPGIWYAGSHGFELTTPDGAHHQNDTAAATIPMLAQTATKLREQLEPIPGVAVEYKRFGVAVHYRNAARSRIAEVAAAVRTAGQRQGLRVTTGREVIELRPDLDWDKGKTLRWVIDHLSRGGPAPLLPIYLGDDITDEDAFDAVHDGGIPIVVRHNDDGDRATAAMFALDSPAQVAEFTERLARQLSDTRVN